MNVFNFGEACNKLLEARAKREVLWTLLLHCIIHKVTVFCID